MIKFLVYTRDTRIFDCDYIIENQRSFSNLFHILIKDRRRVENSSVITTY